MYGARPLRRLVQSAIGDPLARLVLAGSVPDGSTVHVGVAPDDRSLTVTAVAEVVAAPEPVAPVPV